METAKLALKKSQNADVRAFAQKMIHDHEALGKKMAPLMAQAGLKPSISLDTEHQHLYNKLNGASGAEFDKQYVEAMVKDHHEDLKEFQDEANSTQGSEAEGGCGFRGEGHRGARADNRLHRSEDGRAKQLLVPVFRLEKAAC